MVSPRWTVPVELVRALALPMGVANMTSIVLECGLFQPHADVVVSGNGFVAEAYYEGPRYPGRVMALPVMLCGVVKENRVGE